MRGKPLPLDELIDPAITFEVLFFMGKLQEVCRFSTLKIGHSRTLWSAIANPRS